MWPNGRASNIELRIENVLSMFSGGLAVVDDQRQNDVARIGFCVSNILGPAATPFTVSADAAARRAPIASIMAHSAVALIGAVICRSPGNSRREG